MGTENKSPEPDCQKQFQAAVSVIQNLPKNGSYRPSYEEMLRFYSYYKQATMGPCLVPRPGFWDPIGRYKWDAWNSLGKMSREEAMSAYITEMKLVAQKVIDTVPLGEVAEDMFGYFEPLYQVIPDMPRPPETFLRRVTGWKEQAVNGDAGAVSESPCLPKELAPPSPASLWAVTLPTPPQSPIHPGTWTLRFSVIRWSSWSLSRFGLSRREYLEESMTRETAPCPPERKRGCGAACWGPRNWTCGCWRQFEHYRRACRRCRGGCRAWRACPGPRSRGGSPGPVLGHGPLGSRVLHCSSSSCGPSSSSGSSECCGPKRGDCQWRGLCSQLRPSWCALSLPRL
ncbi:acyl-CoA-binding domain-containing protein 4 isoform X7 [Sapajus apella]|uniref:Acyl-CoA-binding domain-containing protein 4 isoform X7 n=1 Tax=Sapajus apella TaxID=9515 RepID=A0A6J3H6P2_SAPAP|nr:acyl-CoA-binding domain-containing protein 4 isoform X7 [Sapajus apella]